MASKKFIQALELLESEKGIEKEVVLEALKEALEKTTIKRGSTYILSDYENILETIENDKRLRDIWNKYSTDYKYAKDISFKMTCDAISTLLTKMYSKVTV